MTDIWDFSSLLDSWAKNAQIDETNTQNDDNFAEIKEQMDKELNEISSQLVLAKSNDPTVLNELNLLSPPIIQTNHVVLDQPEPQNQPSNRSQARSSTSLASVSVRSKNSISNKSMASSKLPPLNKSSLGPLPKPKEAMLTKARKVVKQKIIPKTEKIFKATPSELHLVNFSLLKHYVMTFTLQNVSSRSHGFQVKYPDDPAFSFRILEDVANSQIRPGLHITFEVKFFTKEPRDYEGSIIVIPGPDEPSTAIPIRCYRDPPQLILNDIVDLQAALVYSSKSGSFTITNRGGIASFKFNSAHGQEQNSMFVDGPFILSPSSFELDRGESIEINIQFKPTETGMQKASFEIIAEYFPQKFFFLAQGFAAVPKLHFKICDDDHLFLPFLPSDAYTTKNIEICNDSDVSYPFYIQIVRPKDITKSELKVLYPDTDTETVKMPPPFTVKPASGIIGARDSVSLNITFTPKMFAFYRSKMVIFAHRIPDESGNLGSRKMLTISTEATSGPPSVSIQPPLVRFNDVIPRVPCQQPVDVVNDSDLNVKLQWRKSEVITPTPVVFEIEQQNKRSVDLCLMITKRLSSFTGLIESSSSIFQEQKVDSRYHTALSRKSSTHDSNDISEDPSKPSSQNYAITLSPLSRGHSAIQTDLNEENDKEEKPTENSNDQNEMPNISPIKKSASYKNQRVLFTPTSSQNRIIIDKSGNNGLSQISNEMSVNIDSINQMSFTYSAQIAKPNLVFEPPEIDFGCVLAGHKSFQAIHMTNTTGSPIGFVISYPDKPEWSINTDHGIVETTFDVEIELSYESQTAVSEFIIIKTFWIDEDGKQIKTFPTSTFTIPVYAVFDRPVIDIKNRVIDIGDVYPTIEYQAQIKISLLNQFPTDFSFEGYSNTVTLSSRPLSAKSDSNINQNEQSIRSKSQNNRKHPQTLEVQQRASTAINKQLDIRTDPASDNQTFEEEEEEYQPEVFTVDQYVKTDPKSQHLDVGESCDITIFANFCQLGQLAMPLKCNVIGKSYMCLVLANVQAPKLVLKTEKIDFSSDFVICKRSNSYVVVTNECGVPSTIKVEMIDNCNGVFALEDSSIKVVNPKETVKIPVSCYSEIHGNYNGQLKLLIKDSWQRKEIMIPLHVKALGSFFGFQKHTVGYIKNDNGDFISFGKKIKCGSEKIIRRITLENFSSTEIKVKWSIVNFVKGRHYADVSLDLDDNGLVKLDIIPTDQCQLQEPFKLLTEESIIESHGKTVIVIEFTPNEVGEFRGCVAARSGEFTHTLDLLAIVCD